MVDIQEIVFSRCVVSYRHSPKAPLLWKNICTRPKLWPFLYVVLGPEFDPIVAAINSRDTFPLLENVISKMRDFDLRISSSRGSGNSAIALNTTRTFGSKPLLPLQIVLVGVASLTTGLLLDVASSLKLVVAVAMALLVVDKFHASFVFSVVVQIIKWKIVVLLMRKRTNTRHFLQFKPTTLLMKQGTHTWVPTNIWLPLKLRHKDLRKNQVLRKGLVED
ncbi:uncharacterized protein LOC118348060 isoform X2 [Juglans regia]|uniref:Uncharacterized protein LOC118348060 isoform X2 n=1 Tax=Juglans regia TaxID=51240 RepID=A0A6P9ELC6_JUGRE|nr:uncharacterized protein LOC118348060 isoform X2 [Juglans regia]